MRLFKALPVAILLALPASGAEFPCPSGWAHEAQGCDTAICIAPMEAGRVQIDRFATVEGQTLPEAFDSYEKIVTAVGTPLHDLLSDDAIHLAGLDGLRRDYAGAAQGHDLRVTLVLARNGQEDILLRAIWDASQGLLFQHLIDTAIAEWNPRAE